MIFIILSIEINVSPQSGTPQMPRPRLRAILTIAPARIRSHLTAPNKPVTLPQHPLPQTHLAPPTLKPPYPPLTHPIVHLLRTVHQLPPLRLQLWRIDHYRRVLHTRPGHQHLGE
jgi:hypothetical protein